MSEACAAYRNVADQHKSKIRDVIGTGGKVIREIVAETGAKVDIDDEGTNQGQLLLTNRR